MNLQKIFKTFMGINLTNIVSVLIQESVGLEKHWMLL